MQINPFLLDALKPKVAAAGLLGQPGPLVTTPNFDLSGAKVAVTSPLIGGFVPKVASTSPLVDPQGPLIHTGRAGFPSSGQMNEDQTVPQPGDSAEVVAARHRLREAKDAVDRMHFFQDQVTEHTKSLHFWHSGDPHPHGLIHDLVNDKVHALGRAQVSLEDALINQQHSARSPSEKEKALKRGLSKKNPGGYGRI